MLADKLNEKPLRRFENFLLVNSNWCVNLELSIKFEIILNSLQFHFYCWFWFVKIWTRYLYVNTIILTNFCIGIISKLISFMKRVRNTFKVLFEKFKIATFASLIIKNIAVFRDQPRFTAKLFSYIPANIRLDEDVLKTSFVFIFRIRLQNVLKTSWSRPIYSP